MTRYTVTFDRIGSHHDVAPLIVEAANADELADLIYRFVRNHLVSREVMALVDMPQSKGHLSAGGRDAGRFTFAETPDGGS